MFQRATLKAGSGCEPVIYRANRKLHHSAKLSEQGGIAKLRGRAMCTESSLVPRLYPSTRTIYVRINNTREGKEGESLVVNRALPVRGQQLTR